MGMLGGLGNMFNNALGQAALQQYTNQWYQTYYTTAASTDTYNFVYSQPRVEEKAKGPETALEWLDRRVDEMRVQL